MGKPGFFRTLTFEIRRQSRLILNNRLEYGGQTATDNPRKTSTDLRRGLLKRGKA